MEEPLQTFVLYLYNKFLGLPGTSTYQQQNIAHMHTHTHVTYTYTHIHTHEHTYMYTHTYTHTCTHMHAHTCMHTHTGLYAEILQRMSNLGYLKKMGCSCRIGMLNIQFGKFKGGEIDIRGGDECPPKYTLHTYTHTHIFQFHKTAMLGAQYYTGNFIVTSAVDGQL